MNKYEIVKETARGSEGYYYIIGEQADAPQDGPFLTEEEARAAAETYIRRTHV